MADSPAGGDAVIGRAPRLHHFDGLLLRELQATHQLGHLAERGRPGAEPQTQLGDLGQLPLVLGHFVRCDAITGCGEGSVQVRLGVLLVELHRLFDLPQKVVDTQLDTGQVGDHHLVPWRGLQAVAQRVGGLGLGADAG